MAEDGDGGSETFENIKLIYPQWMSKWNFLQKHDPFSLGNRVTGETEC